MTARNVVLVVDDDQAIVDALCMLLELEGFQTSRYNGGNVMETIKNTHPDVVLLDVWLAGEDGRDVCRSVKADQALHKLPVILISASRDLSSSARLAGADDYIEKPFDMHDVVAKVRRFLEPRHLQTATA